MTSPKYVLGSRNKQDKRIVLTNRRTLISLALATLALLWILQPNRGLLLDILDEAQDPNVALAFLRVLKDADDPSPRLQMAFAKQYYRLKDYEKVLHHLTPLSQFSDPEQLLRAQSMYANSLLQLSHDSRFKEQATRELSRYLKYLPDDLSPEQRQTFAEYALQIGQPAVAHKLLKHHSQGDLQRLFTLALQAGLYDSAMAHGKQLYQRQPSAAHFEQLLALYQQHQRWPQGLALINQHIDAGLCELACLQQGIDFARSADNSASASQFAVQKASISSDSQDWLQASELAVAVGDIATAITWLAKANQAAPSAEHISTLHSYYLWRGDLDNALAMSKDLMRYNPELAQLRQGINEALAQSDLKALSDFYYQLAQTQQLNQEERLQWVNYNDKAYGAKATVKRLEHLSQRFPNEPLYWFQLARFYNFIGQPQRATELWQQIKVPTPSNYLDLNYFAQSFMATGNPQQALTILHQYSNPQGLALDQLITLQELANYNAATDLQRYYQRQRIERGDTSLDPYSLIASHNGKQRQDIDVLWDYYQRTQSPVLLIYLMNLALEQGDERLLNATSEALLANHGDDTSLNMQLLRVRLAMHQERYANAKNLLQQLLGSHPEHDEVKQSAMWLAISIGDNLWLRELYWRVISTHQDSSDMYQVLAIAAQQLGLFQHADLWFQRLNNSAPMSASDKLNWAQILEHQGSLAQASSLRWQVISTLSEQLRQVEGGDVSYRSLVALFVSPALADAQLTKQLLLRGNKADIAALLNGSQSHALQQLVLWQAQRNLKDQQFNAYVQLALALARDDRSAIYQLSYDSVQLDDFTRAAALAQIGENAHAWQLAEQQLGAHTAKRDIAPLQRLLAQQHPLASHGLRYEHVIKDSWQVRSEQLRYYRPMENGQWLLDASYDHGHPKSDLLEDYQQRSAQLSWRFSPQHYLVNRGEVGVAISDRHQKTHYGQFATLIWQPSSRLSHSLKLGHNMATEQSENLFLLGREDSAKWEVNWQPTRYEQLSVSVSRSLFKSDFDDPIAQQWHSTVRLSEQFNFTPSWQAYVQYDHQENTLDQRALTGVSDYLGRPVVAAIFISPRYRRLALGQQLLHGNVGEPGKQVPGMRYWLDSAIGYNFVTDEADYSANIGLGIRVFGNDEFFIKGAWQSADPNGRESLTFNLGYFLDF
ncbi:tetratricopeptide repeat protein [Pseudoalteromonas sp. T1lg75]|uniref:tetratricopeptide repeat protein n=1 Tax=Pseudoalteromonas sp. T1lg75 TaxID=2077102 RepID=UPI000CF711AC|nr:tetratricopeptide repeat protein [Pseudoalteromonas sp. T1lg75]